MSHLNAIKEDLNIPSSLYREIRESVLHRLKSNRDKYVEFAKDLPPNLQTLVLMEINKDIFCGLNLFKIDENIAEFFPWISTKLRSTIKLPGSVIY